MWSMGYVGHRHRKGSADMTGRKIAEREEERVPVVPVIGDGPRGDVPLSDGKREAWCKRVAAGEDEVEAWFVTFRDEVGKERGSKRNAMSSANKLRKKQEVADRIAWLRENDVTAKITHRDKVSDYEEMMIHAKNAFMTGDKASPQYAKVYVEMEKRHDELTGNYTGGGKATIKIEGLGSLLGSVFAKEMRERLGIKKKEEKKIEGEVIDE